MIIFIILLLNHLSCSWKHPSSDHDKAYHDLNLETLENIYDELLSLKEEVIANECPIEHSLIIIDDFANDLKKIQIYVKINEAVIETRHLNCS